MATDTGTLSKQELETVLDYIYGQVEEALADGTRERLREALEEVSDICHPDSELDVDVNNTTVEASFPDKDETDPDDEDED